MQAQFLQSVNSYVLRLPSLGFDFCCWPALQKLFEVYDLAQAQYSSFVLRLIPLTPGNSHPTPTSPRASRRFRLTSHVRVKHFRCADYCQRIFTSSYQLLVSTSCTFIVRAPVELLLRQSDGCVSRLSAGTSPPCFSHLWATSRVCPASVSRLLLARHEQQNLGREIHNSDFASASYNFRFPPLWRVGHKLVNALK